MSLTVPIFPLPEAVLFPRTHLRLHVFEPRYLQMMDYSMANGQRFAIAHLKPGYEKDYFGAPPVYKVATHARILLADRLDDGRWNLLLEGIERIRIISEVQLTPFRLVHYDPLVDEVPQIVRDEAMKLMHTAAAKAEAIANHFENGPRLLTNLVNTMQHPAVVADVIAAITISDAYNRQSILNETDVLRRLKLVHVHLDGLLAELREGGFEVRLPQAENS